MMHLAATIIPPALQAPHATDQNNFRARRLQRRLSRIQKSVYRKLDKNFLENLNRVFHYSVIGGDAVIGTARAKPNCLSLIDNTTSADARMTPPYATGGST